VLAAFEAESATHAMALRIWKDEPDLASSTGTTVAAYIKLAQHITQPVQEILDIGCSVGISTLALHRFYQSQQDTPVHTIGLDLSPYMLTVARDANGEIAQWLHANAEETGLPDRPLISSPFSLSFTSYPVRQRPRF